MKRFAIVAALALVVAACGSASDGEIATLDTSTDTTEISNEQEEIDAEAAVLEFAACMRDSGIPDYPDPDVDANGNFRLFGGGGGPGQLNADRDTLLAAFEECGDIVEGVIQDTFRNIDESEFQDNFLEFAECMREQGIDMPDPDFSGGFGPGQGGGLFGNFDLDDPAFQEAADECRSIFEGSFAPGRLGGGDGG
ncbi:MAG: hypothetical protein U9N56_08965 [Actinomycetota bacterium]|nr:hypothetical protein [Actinomycetota bacterium]